MSEVWALFDHDARLDRQIDPVCAEARRTGVHVALSHPSFADYGKVDKRIDVPRFEALMADDGLRHALCLAEVHAAEVCPRDVEVSGRGSW